MVLVSISSVLRVKHVDPFDRIRWMFFFSEKIFISFITPDGLADRSGLLKRGDQILSVNGHDFTRISRDEATAILKSCRDETKFVVVNKIDGKNFIRSSIVR